MQQFVKKMLHKLCTTLLLDLCGNRRNTVFRRFFHNAPQFGAFFRLGFERATLSQGVGLFLDVDLEENDALSGIAAHLQGGRRTFTDYGALARKDAAPA